MMLLLILLCVGYVQSDSFTFLTLGDRGGQPKEPYYTGSQMLAAQNGIPFIANQYKAKMVLALGDNFYGSGIQGDDHNARFNETFESVYNATSLQIPWYPIAGNHDHNGNVTAQIFYSNDSARWHYPDYYYTFCKIFSKQHVKYSIQFVMIDTVIFSGMSYHDEETDEFVKPEGPEKCSTFRPAINLVRRHFIKKYRRLHIYR
eukprot:UN02415